MARSVARLAPDRMTNGALWYACRSLAKQLGGDPYLSLKHRQFLAEDLCFALQELEMRGEQLSLLPKED